MRIVVTGGAGFIGKHLVTWLAERRHTVLVIDDFSTGRPSYIPAGVACEKRDLTTLSSADCAAILESFGADAVIHLAAMHFIPDCIARPERTFAVNTASTHMIVEALKQYPVSRFVFASTLDVYAIDDRVHLETEALAPANVYGVSKALSEQLVAYAYRVGACRSAVALRLANVFGPFETNPHLIPDVIDRLAEPVGAELVMGYLGATRDFVFVEDVAAAFGMAATDAPAGLHTMNIGTGTPVAVREVVATLQRFVNDRRPMRENPANFRTFDRVSLTPSVDLARNVLGWSARWRLEDGLAETVKTARREGANE